LKNGFRADEKLKFFQFFLQRLQEPCQIFSQKRNGIPIDKAMKKAYEKTIINFQETEQDQG
jgi:hypothetical protein